MRIKVDIEGLEKFEEFFDTKSWYRAQKRTTTEIGRKLRKDLVKDVRKTYNIKASTLKKKIRTRVEKKGEGENFEWNMFVKGRPLSLYHFGARQTKKGVSVKVKKSEGRKVVKGAFIAKGQVFKRVSKKSYPIKALKTLSIPQMFNEEIVTKNLKNISDEYVKRFEHNLLYYLSNNFPTGKYNNKKPPF